MTCVSAYDGDSNIATIPASHYSIVFSSRITTKGAFTRGTSAKSAWTIGELPTDSRIPWVISPELRFRKAWQAQMPHPGGYNAVNGHGPQAHAVQFTTF
jgi:hypothetical protein